MNLKYAVSKAKALRPNNSVTDQYLIDAVNEVEREVGQHMARHEQFHTAGIWWPIPQYTTDDLGVSAEEKKLLLSDWTDAVVSADPEFVMAWEQYAMAYVWRICAEIDQILGEFDRYNNDAGKYEATLQEGKNYVRRTYKPLQDHRRGWRLI